MDAISVKTSTLAIHAIEALEDAYYESTSDKAKQSIAAAYTAITLLKISFGKSYACNDVLDTDDYFDPSEYCAAI
jgi:hypothetical protein